MRKNKAMLALLFLIYACAAVGQALSATAAEGKILYQKYCQSCHGEAAKGNGPVAQYLILPAADLTRIAIRRNGDFPEKELQKIIDGRMEVRAHGNSDMPVWGDAFRREGTAKEADENIQKLVAYLRGIQEEEKE